MAAGGKAGTSGSSAEGAWASSSSRGWEMLGGTAAETPLLISGPCSRVMGQFKEPWEGACGVWGWAVKSKRLGENVL